ncbi:hypothetical protein HK102_010574 [Quaeritorhiza haematococci]|nr:hypothetical protein HK102_010574 [Quaeritorhiza haematococci]
MTPLSFALLALSMPALVAAQGFSPDLVPSTGVEAGAPDCAGDKPSPVLPGVNVPCRCPPPAAELAAQVQRKVGDNFPAGLDLESRIRRYEITLSALQDLRCPASSTRMKGRLDSLTALRRQSGAEIEAALAGLGPNDTPAGRSGAPAPAPAPVQGGAELVPSHGVEAGAPDCAGDKPSPVLPGVNVPCRCPPPQEALAAQALSKVGGNFPAGLDLESRIRRYEITLSALQDLKCPASSTTLKGCLDSLTRLRAAPRAQIDATLAGLGPNDTPAANRRLKRWVQL